MHHNQTSTAKFLAVVTRLESRSLSAVVPGGEPGGDLETLLDGEDKTSSGGGFGGGGVGFADLIMRLDWRGQSYEEP